MLGFNGGLIGVPRAASPTGATGLWLPNEQAMARRSEAWPIVDGDPLFGFVSLLLPFNGANGSPVFLDASARGVAVNRFGDAQLSTAQSRWGGSSLLLDGTGDYATVSSPSTELREWWTSTFQIDAWVRVAAFTQSTFGVLGTLLGNMEPVTGTNYWSFGATNDGRVRFYYFNGAGVTVASAGAIALNTWTHLRMTHSGGTIRIFINGTLDGSAVVSGTPQSAVANPFTIGAAGNGFFNGYIDDLRIQKGGTVSTVSFTPPTAPFLAQGLPGSDPLFGAVSLLLPLNGVNNSTAFTDLSPNGVIVTRNGTAALSTAQQRWGTASLRINGGSDWLDIPGSALLSFPGDFTVEAWVRMDAAVSGLQTIIEIGNYTNGVLIRSSGNSGDVWINGNNLGNIANFFTTEVWGFVHVSRTGTAARVAVDGTIRLTGTVSGTANSDNQAARIGYPRHTGGQQLVGYIDDLRITKGVARAIDVPTGPFPGSG